MNNDIPDKDKVTKAVNICIGRGKCDDCPYKIKEAYSTMDCRKYMLMDVLKLLNNSVTQTYVDQIRWERDVALAQLSEIGKGFGERMDDIADLLERN